MIPSRTNWRTPATLAALGLDPANVQPVGLLGERYCQAGWLESEAWQLVSQSPLVRRLLQRAPGQGCAALGN